MNDFYCDEALSGRTPVEVVAETDPLTNLGTYQDSKHLHVHVASGAQIRSD